MDAKRWAIPGPKSPAPRNGRIFQSISWIQALQEYLDRLQDVRGRFALGQSRSNERKAEGGGSAAGFHPTAIRESAQREGDTRGAKVIKRVEQPRSQCKK